MSHDLLTRVFIHVCFMYMSRAQNLTAPAKIQTKQYSKTVYKIIKSMYAKLC